MNLFLVLTTEWYNMIESLEKKTEYRAITKYWIRRILMDVMVHQSSNIMDYDALIEYIKSGSDLVQYDFLEFDTVTFQRGYNKQNGRMTFHLNKISVDTGKQEWGALPGEKYFCIDLSHRLS